MGPFLIRSKAFAIVLLNREVTFEVFHEIEWLLRASVLLVSGVFLLLGALNRRSMDFLDSLTLSLELLDHLFESLIEVLESFHTETMLIILTCCEHI